MFILCAIIVRPQRVGNMSKICAHINLFRQRETDSSRVSKAGGAATEIKEMTAERVGTVSHTCSRFPVYGFQVHFTFSIPLAVPQRHTVALGSNQVCLNTRSCERNPRRDAASLPEGIFLFLLNPP